MRPSSAWSSSQAASRPTPCFFVRAPVSQKVKLLSARTSHCNLSDQEDPLQTIAGKRQAEAEPSGSNEKGVRSGRTSPAAGGGSSPQRRAGSPREANRRENAPPHITNLVDPFFAALALQHFRRVDQHREQRGDSTRVFFKGQEVPREFIGDVASNVVHHLQQHRLHQEAIHPATSDRTASPATLGSPSSPHFQPQQQQQPFSLNRVAVARGRTPLQGASTGTLQTSVDEMESSSVVRLLGPKAVLGTGGIVPPAAAAAASPRRAAPRHNDETAFDPQSFFFRSAGGVFSFPLVLMRLRRRLDAARQRLAERRHGAMAVAFRARWERRHVSLIFRWWRRQREVSVFRLRWLLSATFGSWVVYKEFAVARRRAAREKLLMLLHRKSASMFRFWRALTACRCAVIRVSVAHAKSTRSAMQKPGGSGAGAAGGVDSNAYRRVILASEAHTVDVSHALDMVAIRFATVEAREAVAVAHRERSDEATRGRWGGDALKSGGRAGVGGTATTVPARKMAPVRRRAVQRLMRDAFVIEGKRKALEEQRQAAWRELRSSRMLARRSFVQWRSAFNDARAATLHRRLLVVGAFQRWRTKFQRREHYVAGMAVAVRRSTEALGKACLRRWRERTDTELRMTHFGTLLGLARRGKMLRFAYLLQNDWSSATFVEAFHHWRRYCVGRRRWRLFVQQQHAEHCDVLVARAFVVWKSHGRLLWDGTVNPGGDYPPDRMSSTRGPFVEGAAEAAVNNNNNNSNVNAALSVPSSAGTSSISPLLHSAAAGRGPSVSPSRFESSGSPTAGFAPRSVGLLRPGPGGRSVPRFAMTVVADLAAGGVDFVGAANAGNDTTHGVVVVLPAQPRFSLTPALGLGQQQQQQQMFATSLFSDRSFQGYSASLNSSVAFPAVPLPALCPPPLNWAAIKSTERLLRRIDGVDKLPAVASACCHFVANTASILNYGAAGGGTSFVRGLSPRAPAATARGGGGGPLLGGGARDDSGGGTASSTTSNSGGGGGGHGASPLSSRAPVGGGGAGGAAGGGSWLSDAGSTMPDTAERARALYDRFWPTTRSSHVVGDHARTSAVPSPVKRHPTSAIGSAGAGAGGGHRQGSYVDGGYVAARVCQAMFLFQHVRHCLRAARARLESGWDPADSAARPRSLTSLTVQELVTMGKCALELRDAGGDATPMPANEFSFSLAASLSYNNSAGGAVATAAAASATATHAAFAKFTGDSTAAALLHARRTSVMALLLDEGVAEAQRRLRRWRSEERRRRLAALFTTIRQVVPSAVFDFAAEHCDVRRTVEYVNNGISAARAVATRHRMVSSFVLRGFEARVLLAAYGLRGPSPAIRRGHGVLAPKPPTSIPAPPKRPAPPPPLWRPPTKEKPKRKIQLRVMKSRTISRAVQRMVVLAAARFKALGFRSPRQLHIFHESTSACLVPRVEEARKAAVSLLAPDKLAAGNALLAGVATPSFPAAAPAAHTPAPPSSASAQQRAQRASIGSGNVVAGQAAAAAASAGSRGTSGVYQWSPTEGASFDSPATHLRHSPSTSAAATTMDRVTS